MNRLDVLLAILLCISCAKKPSQDAPEDQLEQVRDMQEWRHSRGMELTDENGWIVPRDCDGMHWSGKFAAAFPGRIGFDPRVAEYPEEPGRFSRRAPPYCWTEDDGNQGSDTTWSRDAFILGLGSWAWRARDLALLQDHERFGRSAVWKMGEPLDDGRVLYTPQVVGMLYQMIYSLNGPNNANRHWPSTYPSGLTDYQAHLQVVSIVLRGEMAMYQGRPQDAPREPKTKGLALDISNSMYERLREHAQREPDCPLFQAAFAKYSGDFDHAIELCEMADPPACSYVRCDDIQRCKLADDAFACDLLLRRTGPF